MAPQSEVTCVTGQFITLSVGICNLSASVLHQVQLSVQFYQDYQNGEIKPSAFFSFVIDDVLLEHLAKVDMLFFDWTTPKE